MSFEITQHTYDEISKIIESDSSPVGIDAKKTHIIILKMLRDISERLAAVEKKLDGKS